MSKEDKHYWPFIRPNKKEHQEQLIRELSAPQKSRVEPAHRIQPLLYSRIKNENNLISLESFRSANRESPSLSEAIVILAAPEFDSIRREVLKLKPKYIIVYARDKAICQLCLKFCEPSEASLDHIIPRRYKSSNAVHNLQLSHRECNMKCCSRPECPHEQYKMKTIIQFGNKLAA